VIVGPGRVAPEIADAGVVASSTLNIFIATDPCTDPDHESPRSLASPANQIADPPANRRIRPNGREWGRSPGSLLYGWGRLRAPSTSRAQGPCL